MSGRDRDRFRKYESGAAKAKKHKLREEFDKTQKEALDKYKVTQKNGNFWNA